jgi:hypothetical protein
MPSAFYISAFLISSLYSDQSDGLDTCHMNATMAFTQISFISTTRCATYTPKASQTPCRALRLLKAPLFATPPFAKFFLEFGSILHDPAVNGGMVDSDSASVTALIDRIVERCEVIKIEGDSFRQKRFLERQIKKTKKPSKAAAPQAQPKGTEPVLPKYTGGFCSRLRTEFQKASRICRGCLDAVRLTMKYSW